MTGLRLKTIGFGPPEPSQDIYDSYDNFVVNEPWTWGPQHLRLAKGSQETDTAGDELSEESYASDDSTGYTRRSRRRRRRRRVQARQVLPLTAGLRRNLPEPLPISVDGGQWVTEMDDEKLVLIYPLTFGFSLNAKKWSKFHALELSTTN